jgi:hypothetical protein
LRTDSNAQRAVDDATSKACTRSGTLALLLSVAVVILIPSWVERPRRIALAQYISYRVNLATALDTLEADPIWQTYKGSQASAELMSIAELLNLGVPVPDGSTGEPAKPKSPPAAPTTSRGVQPAGPQSSPSAPAAPQIIRVVVEKRLEQVPAIADFLNKLNDPQLLTNSMKESNYFAYSIVRWGDKRGELMYRNVVRHICTVTRIEVPTLPHGAPKPDVFVPLLDRDALLKCLTFQDARELAAFELPTFGNPLQLDERIQKSVDLKPGSLPGDLYTASIVVQIFLFFVIIYFGAFAREAISSADFPAQGTHFGAFSRSRGTLLVMFLALWTPLLSSITMSIISRKWPLMICNLPILYAVLYIQLVLHRKSYFDPLRPRRRIAKPSK